jgi:hypothetical protein
MPNRTVRAAATGLPKDNPNEDAEGVKLVHQFELLYSNWLHARAQLADPALRATDEEGDVRIDAVEAAARNLLGMPAPVGWAIWRKWEVLELYARDDACAGMSRDNYVCFALGCLKADIAKFVRDNS